MRFRALFMRTGWVALLAAGSLGAAAGPGVSLTDVSSASGLDLGDGSGGPPKDYIVDANGNGAALFDYDNDGDLDALLVNGSTRERMARGGDAMGALYRHNGTGRFSDVTAGSGFNRPGWGMGACAADGDNDG